MGALGKNMINLLKEMTDLKMTKQKESINQNYFKGSIVEYHRGNILRLKSTVRELQNKSNFMDSIKQNQSEHMDSMEVDRLCRDIISDLEKTNLSLLKELEHLKEHGST